MRYELSFIDDALADLISRELKTEEGWDFSIFATRVMPFMPWVLDQFSNEQLELIENSAEVSCQLDHQLEGWYLRSFVVRPWDSRESYTANLTGYMGRMLTDDDRGVYRKAVILTHLWQMVVNNKQQ